VGITNHLNQILPPGNLLLIPFRLKLQLVSVGSANVTFDTLVPLRKPQKPGIRRTSFVEFRSLGLCRVNRGARPFRAGAIRVDGSAVTARTPLLGVCRGQSQGFALLIVLWTLVLIAFIIIHVSAVGRTEVRISENLAANAIAEVAADGGISAAIFNLSDPQPDQRWPLDIPRAIQIGHALVTVRLEDEATWINPNTAPPQLVEALLRATGSDPASARTLATAISEWVGSAPVARPQAAMLGDYQAAGLNYGPPGAPLETIDELGRVLGMTPAVLAAIRPHLTLFGTPEPNPASTDRIVAQALAQLPTTGVPPPVNAPPPDLLTTRITATAVGRGDARVTRVAIARFGAMLPRGYEVLYWGRGFE
jgi:general secretion pathway protein K